MRFMQEMMELSSQQQKEQLPPRAVQIVSHPFFGRVVLTAGPAQFGVDLFKSSSGVSMINVTLTFVVSVFFLICFCLRVGILVILYSVCRSHLSLPSFRCVALLP